jgi:DNA-directed RNA polymerase subunit RPC12/RpoP
MADDGLTRIQCPECAKGFDIEAAPFSQDILCPYCGAEMTA